MKTKATYTITDESFRFLGRIVTAKIFIPTGILTSDEKIYFTANTIGSVTAKVKEFARTNNLQLKRV